MQWIHKADVSIRRHIHSLWFNRSIWLLLFFFVDTFLLTFFLGCCSTTGCVIHKCWWIANRGSDWKVGWFRTLENCFPSFNLMKKDTWSQSYIVNVRLPSNILLWREGNTNISFGPGLQLGFKSSSGNCCRVPLTQEGTLRGKKGYKPSISSVGFVACSFSEKTIWFLHPTI